MAKKKAAKAAKQQAAATPAPATKKAAKKATRAKRVPIKTAPHGKHFVLADQTVLRDIRELAMSLETMGDDIFWHHVNDERNDFANWISGVLEDQELADALRETRDKVNAQLTVLRHIVKQI